MLGLEGGTAVNLTCSWNVSAGEDAVIGARFYGSGGGVSQLFAEPTYQQGIVQPSVFTAQVWE